VVYDDDSTQPPQHEFGGGDLPAPVPTPPPTPEIYHLIANVVKEYQVWGLQRILAEARARQAERRIRPEIEITAGMVRYVKQIINPG
jgi:hypothetical protein